MKLIETAISALSSLLSFFWLGQRYKYRQRQSLKVWKNSFLIVTAARCYASQRKAKST